jgi:hypothetical protein
MDSLSVEKMIRENIPFLMEMPAWLWFVIIWLITNMLFRPYVDAILRQYQNKFDTAAKITPSVLKRIPIEFLRIILISTQFPHSILFLLVPQRKRLRIWRKNYIVFYVWIYSKHFPSWKYYKDARKWFEENVYLNSETSFTHPESLKEDGIYINKMLQKDKLVSHEKYIEMINNDFKPIVRVGSAIKFISPKEWLGPKLVIVWILFSWIYSLLIVYSIYLLFTRNIFSAIFFLIGVLLFSADRYMLRKRITNYAKLNKDFFTIAVDKRVIQLNW